MRAAHHRLSRTPVYVPEEGEYYSSAWSEAHRVFHRTLLDGCGNSVLLETFDRMWTASELARRWSIHRNPDRHRSRATGPARRHDRGRTGRPHPQRTREDTCGTWATGTDDCILITTTTWVQ